MTSTSPVAAPPRVDAARCLAGDLAVARADLVALHGRARGVAEDVREPLALALRGLDRAVAECSARCR